MSKKRHIATEKMLFHEMLEALPEQEKWAETKFSRLKRIAKLSSDARVLDIGASWGGFIVAAQKLGYRCEGIEPWEEARLNAIKLSDQLEIPIHIMEGRAESLPYDANTFDIVHAASTIEHVSDVEMAFKEICRVLKPSGIFWFNVSNALCPSAQGEIEGFPLFGWYPNSLKLKIMSWAKNAKPHLVGYTMTPAINWFTPAKAHTLLYRCGFKHVYDRWDLRGEDEGGRIYKVALRLARSSGMSKFLADVFVCGSSYAAIK
ncbi:MAG: class I SAM-dependent methyltransferase [Nitrososphaera sp.]